MCSSDLSLDTLLLSKSAVTDAGLAVLKDLSKLERLYLADTAITDAGLKHLAGLEKLTTLSLERTQITDVGLQQLSGLKNLETLLLSGTNITDDGLAHLAALEQLRHLYLSHCKIRGPGLLHLKALEKLENLNLSSNAVGDDAVDFIAAVPNLKHVELYETGFTREGIVKLRGALPKAGVYVSPELAATSNTNTGSEATIGTTKATETRPIEGAVWASIEQRLADAKLVPDFQRHVIPLLGRLGCNGRSCHGSFQGQGEFRLSMFGYDFDMDYKNLLERVDLKQTGESLILNKPTSEDEHGGGLRFSPGSWQQNLLRRWIEAGAKGVGENAAQFVRLDVTPTELVFKQEGDEVQLRVVAVWSDGSREDVTSLARFESKNDAVADVSPSGLVTSTGQGDAYVITFYDNGIESSLAVLPVSEQFGDRYPAVPTPTAIDEHVVAKLKTLGLTPSALCTDQEFLRRVSLDMVGTLPTLKELREFIADDSADKRSKKRSEEHTSELQSRRNLVCRLLLEKKKNSKKNI